MNENGNLVISINENIKLWILDLLSKRERVVFLSARDVLRKWETYKWLQRNCLILRRRDLFLVQDPSEKLLYLNHFIKIGVNVNYIDDLSYNHEKGDVLLYTELIAHVKKLPINYIGIEHINALEFNKLKVQ
jgi:hypothetical protein